MNPETQAFLACCGIMLTGLIAGWFLRYIYDRIQDHRRRERMARTSTARQLLKRI